MNSMREKERHRARRRNHVARDLNTPKYHQRKKESKKAYRRDKTNLRKLLITDQE